MVRYDQEAAERGQKYIEDQRGSGGRRGASASAGGLPIGKVGGLAGVIIAVLVAVLGGGALNDGGGTNSGFGIGSARLDDGAQVATDVGNTGPAVDPDADTKAYMGFLMLDIQEVWTEYFEQAGLQYQETKMVLFSDAVSTGCGNATSAVGPFYCPAPGDNKIYVDLDFYDELADRFGAPGDFAQAYVIAHEVGHHIQSVTGISDEVRQAQSENPGAKNELSVRQELQADCLAGPRPQRCRRRLGLLGRQAHDGRRSAHHRTGRLLRRSRGRGRRRRRSHPGVGRYDRRSSHLDPRFGRSPRELVHDRIPFG